MPDSISADSSSPVRSRGTGRSGRVLAAGGLLFAFALLLRMVMAAGIPVVEQDAAGGYLHQAREILRGHWAEGVGTYFPPGYPLAVAALGLLGLNVVAAGKAVSVLSGALLLIPVFRMAREWYDPATAWVAATLAAAYPVLVLNSDDAVSEGLYTLVVMAAIALGYRAITTGTPAAAAGLGVLWGTAYLIRGEALAMMAIFLALAAVARWRESPESGRAGRAGRAAIFAAAVIGGFLVPAAPYIGYLRSHSGRVELSGKTLENLLAYDIEEGGRPVNIESVRLGLTPDGQRLQMEVDKQGSALEFLWQNRGRQIRKYLRNASEAYLSSLPHTLYPVFLLLMGIGIHASVRNPGGPARCGYLAAFFLFPFLFYPIFLIEDRYFAPLAPVGLLWAARGLVLGAGGAPSRWRGYRLAAGTLLLLLLHAAPLLQHARADRWSYAVEHREAGDWLRGQAPAHPRVMNRKSYVAFYADGTSIITPAADYPHLIAYARAKQVDYLVVDDRYTLAVRPGLRFLLDNEEEPPELERVYERKERQGARIAVFRIRPEGPEGSLP